MHSGLSSRPLRMSTSHSVRAVVWSSRYLSRPTHLQSLLMLSFKNAFYSIPLLFSPKYLMADATAADPVFRNRCRNSGRQRQEAASCPSEFQGLAWKVIVRNREKEQVQVQRQCLKSTVELVPPSILLGTKIFATFFRSVSSLKSPSPSSHLEPTFQTKKNSRTKSCTLPPRTPWPSGDRELASGAGRGAGCELAVRNDVRHRYRGNSEQRQWCAGTVLIVQVIHHDLINDTNSPYPLEIDLEVSRRRSRLAPTVKSPSRLPPRPPLQRKSC